MPADKDYFDQLLPHFVQYARDAADAKKGRAVYGTAFFRTETHLL